MADKLNRIYTLTIQGRTKPQKTYTIQNPITCEFDISHEAMGSASIGHFKLYNLSTRHQNDIYKDLASDGNFPMFMSFAASYATFPFAPPRIFQGDVKNAYTYKDGGSPDIITEIEAFDGGDAVAQAHVDYTRAAGWDMTSVAQDLVKLLAPYNITVGAISPNLKYSGTRGLTFSGNLWNAIKDIVGGNVVSFIHMGKVYIMKEGEIFEAPTLVQTINSKNGLIGVPRKQGNIVSFQMLFEPRLMMYQKLTIDSSILPLVNGDYLLRGLGHLGVISGAVDGGAVTSVKAYMEPNGGFTTIPTGAATAI